MADSRYLPHPAHLESPYETYGGLYSVEDPDQLGTVQHNYTGLLFWSQAGPLIIETIGIITNREQVEAIASELNMAFRRGMITQRDLDNS
jgi:hypothetical protein